MKKATIIFVLEILADVMGLMFSFCGHRWIGLGILSGVLCFSLVACVRSGRRLRRLRREHRLDGFKLLIMEQRRRNARERN